MAVQLICASHSPLMMTDVEESEANSHRDFFGALESASKELHAFGPELVVVFWPDHFNGFFYELMPSFCIGTAAETSADWRLEKGPLRVPRDLALAAVRHLQARDFDVALSHQMRVDHGVTIPLVRLTGALARYPVLPVFVNCAADPRPSFRRVRAFGAAVGEYLATLGMRVAILGSGGLSHDPPTPRLDQTPPELARRLIVRQSPGQDELDAREARVVKAARDLVVGKGPCLPPNEDWDRRFLEHFTAGQLEPFDRLTDAEIDRIAGFGGHEVRTWVAASAAAAVAAGKTGAKSAAGAGGLAADLRFYRLIPEWITGMGVVLGHG